MTDYRVHRKFWGIKRKLLCIIIAHFHFWWKIKKPLLLTEDDYNSK